MSRWSSRFAGAATGKRAQKNMRPGRVPEAPRFLDRLGRKNDFFEVLPGCASKKSFFLPRRSRQESGRKEAEPQPYRTSWPLAD